MDNDAALHGCRQPEWQYPNTLIFEALKNNMVRGFAESACQLRPPDEYRREIRREFESRTTQS